MDFTFGQRETKLSCGAGEAGIGALEVDWEHWGSTREFFRLRPDPPICYQRKGQDEVGAPSLTNPMQPIMIAKCGFLLSC
jgi:hypothetical protein